VPDIGGEGKVYMKKKIKYGNEKIGKIEIVKDFLPTPEELVFKEDTVKITLNLSKTSVEFFKDLAKKHDSQYQKVIRTLLDNYTSVYSE
jgi:predicted DNA binding CopG/RHH family protein